MEAWNAPTDPTGSRVLVLPGSPEAEVARAWDWFDRRTSHHSRYADRGSLLEAKRHRGVTVSVCIPTINEAATVGHIIRSIRKELMEDVPLVDELVVVDSASPDGTEEIARAAGAVVYQDREIAPETGLIGGKGDALWKSLFVLEGDLIVWIDADIRDYDFTTRFVYGPLGPLLLEEDVLYVKAFYQRPIRDGDRLAPTGGGRVTELVARPVLNLLFPWLSAVVQPLSGEYAGTRETLESIPFITHYGVELGMLIDVAERFGLESIAQVDLDRRVHRNRPIEQLSRMSFEILQAAMLRLSSMGRSDLRAELNPVLHQFGELASAGPEASTLEVQERPPVIEVPRYRDRVASDGRVPV